MENTKKEKVGFLSLSCFAGSIVSLILQPVLFLLAIEPTIPREKYEIPAWPIIFPNIIIIISCIACLIIYKKQNKAGTFIAFVGLCFTINVITVMLLFAGMKY